MQQFSFPLPLSLPFPLSFLTGPTKVSDVFITILEAASLNVSWAIPQSDMNITQYQVQYRTDETTSWSSGNLVSVSPPATSTIVNVTKLCSEYIFRVRAVSAVGAGQWSAEQTQRIGSEFYTCTVACVFSLYNGNCKVVKLFLLCTCQLSSTIVPEFCSYAFFKFLTSFANQLY